MKYTFEWCGLPNCYINQQLTYLLALKRGWGSKHSLQSSGPTSAQLLKDKEHSPEPEMGMQLGRSGLKPSRINLAARICTNIFSISLKTTEVATISLCLPCRKSWGTAFFFFSPPEYTGVPVPILPESCCSVRGKCDATPIWLLFITESNKHFRLPYKEKLN